MRPPPPRVRPRALAGCAPLSPTPSPAHLRESRVSPANAGVPLHWIRPPPPLIRPRVRATRGRPLRIRPRVCEIPASPPWMRAPIHWIRPPAPRIRPRVCSIRAPPPLIRPRVRATHAAPPLLRMPLPLARASPPSMAASPHLGHAAVSFIGTRPPRFPSSLAPRGRRTRPYGAHLNERRALPRSCVRRSRSSAHRSHSFVAPGEQRVAPSEPRAAKRRSLVYALRV